MINHCNRRQLLQLAGGSLIAASLASRAKAQTEAEANAQLVEQQFGDEGMVAEQLRFNPFEVQRLYGATKAQFRPRIKNFSERVLDVARRYVGKNRQNAEIDITRFLNVFNLGFRYNSGELVPFCAAGLSYIAALAYIEALGEASGTPPLSQLRSTLPDIDHHHFYPSPSVLDMYHVAAGKHRWLARSEAKKVLPGSLVIFDWNKNGGANHVGMVERVGANVVHTVEFNTSSTAAGSQRDGGQIAVKERPLDQTIKGFIATNLVTAI